MLLFFSDVCALLSTLEKLALCDRLDLPAGRYQRQKRAVCEWFTKHEVTVQESSTLIVALLSALLPAKRTDRVYNTQRPRLVSLLKRWLSLGVERQKTLEQWRMPGRGDLGECVERVMRQTDDPPTLRKCKVNLEEVDAALANLASRNRFSGPKVKEREHDGVIQASFESIYRRLHSSEAKWLTRMILKDFSHVHIEADLLYSALDTRFPDVMQIYDDLESAVGALKHLPTSYRHSDCCRALSQHRTADISFLSPQIGIKVGSPIWVKARGGVPHAVSIIDCRTMSVERKHDGEYCQIHIDLSKGEDCVLIFSKSGKNSTTDRTGVHDAIKQSLCIGKNNCKFSKNCILEGELLVWSDRTTEILDFHKIRKHVSRSGSFLGTEKDSQPHSWEHLMMVFFDVLLIDDEPVIHQTYKERRQRLIRLIERIKGKADVVWRRVVDFSQSDGVQALKTCLANALVQRWEGLVLKPVNEPYFNTGDQTKGRYTACWVKLKKDCIGGLGDTADLSIVGAGYDPKIAAKLRFPCLSWTHFFLACLTNKQDVLERKATPSFFIIDCVQKNIKTEDVMIINQHGRFMEMRPTSDEALKAFVLSFAWMDPALPKLSTVFKQPFVCEIAGSGFDKPPNCDFFTLRFPRVLKLHWDRDWIQSVSLRELQQMATTARSIPSRQSLVHEVQDWVARLGHQGTNEKMASLVYTDDEEVPQEDAENVNLAPVASHSAHNARNDSSSPFVRTDSGQMARRRGQVEVLQRRASTESIIHVSSENRSFTCSITSPNMDQMKRSTKECATIEQNKTQKKARLSNVSEPKSEATWLTDIAIAKGRIPLQEITNATQSTIRQGLKDTLESQQASLEGFSEVGRTIIEAVDLPQERNQTIKTSIKHSSAVARRTISPARYFPTSSQVKVTREAQPTQRPSGSEDASPFPASLSTDETLIPDLASSSIILSPYLLNELPNDLSCLLQELPTQTLSLPPSTTIGQTQTLRPCHANNARTLYLIDASHSLEVIASSLHKLAPCLKIWHPLLIQVWDWRVVSIGRDTSRGMTAELFVANMSWVPPYGGDNEGNVLVQWADGATTEARGETFGRR